MKPQDDISINPGATYPNLNNLDGSPFFAWRQYTVSYTHLDVYKRQVYAIDAAGDFRSGGGEHAAKNRQADYPFSHFDTVCLTTFNLIAISS